MPPDVYKEIMICTACHKVKMSNKEHSLLAYCKHAAQCTNCGHEGIIAVSKEFAWLFVF
jgi:hypothetical protein